VSCLPPFEMRDANDEAWRRLDAVETEVVSAGWIEPVGAGVDERMLWRACDVALLTEGCFHRRVEPEQLDEVAMRPWIERLRGDFIVPALDAPDAPFEPERRHWLLDRGRRVGIIKLGVSRFRGPWLFVHSLWVRPEERRRGIAGDRLEALARVAARHDLVGLRLATSWTWQNSLRFYLARNFWVYMWKHDIQLVLEPALPLRRLVQNGDAAHFELVEGGEPRRLWTARRADDRLVLEQEHADRSGDVEIDHRARATFAMLLALAGWPLVRSEDHWARRYHSSDVGEPEGLAYKIGVFESVARDRGWVVDTVEIPGLDRWQAWARGEEHGCDTQQLRDLEIVLHERTWKLDDAWRERIRGLDRAFALDTLLRRAVTAASFDEWLATARQLLEQGR
jgi:GNAT superfamily N-acetyltransferase